MATQETENAALTELKNEVRRAITAAHERGITSFHEILACCDGADPRLVAELWSAKSPRRSETELPAESRQGTSELAARFPVSDPVNCQWWFTIDTVERLATRIFQSIDSRDGVAAFLGAPTTAFQYSRRFGRAALFEIDHQVIEAVQTSDQLTAVTYDVADELAVDTIGVYSAVLLDPPWYPDLIRAFLHRGLQLVRPGSSVFCSLPPRLTRPSIIAERQKLMEELLAAGVEIVALERGATRYLVPEFERLVLRDIDGFDGRSWRSGDLLHLRKRGSEGLNNCSVLPCNVRPYARNPRKFRVFLGRNPPANQNSAAWIQVNEKFGRTISRRAVDPAQLHWWTSEKIGGTLHDGPATEKAVKAWAANLSLEQTVQRLASDGMPNRDAASLCTELNTKLGLWSRHGLPTVRKEPPQTTVAQGLSEFATKKASGHPYVRRSDDGYRGQFQRDRDRVVWSRGLRQLANKTQVFPVTSDDFLRNRLAHSMEVAQLAATIGTSFHLDQHLIESGALAHDIGHTPFGHAGEEALDHLLDAINPGLGGFNHYEHGVDVVRWLEDAYQSPAMGGIHGLNLASEVAECIFKHTYCQTGEHFSQQKIYERSKHRKYFDGSLCHIEGQAVRIADKVSYLISDLEDGIRMGVFSAEDLMSCRLLRRAPIDLTLQPGESLHERFLAQRPLLIGILMEDIIEETDYRLARRGSVEAVRKAGDYTVSHSADLQADVDQVWTFLQNGKLHRDARVRIANLQAARIVRELTLLFAAAPELVDPRFSDGHRRLHSSDYLEHYRSQTGPKVILRTVLASFLAADGGQALGFTDGKDLVVPVEYLVQAKDFVAGLSDTRARELYQRLLSGVLTQH